MEDNFMSKKQCVNCHWFCTATKTDSGELIYITYGNEIIRGKIKDKDSEYIESFVKNANNNIEYKCYKGKNINNVKLNVSSMDQINTLIDDSVKKIKCEDFTEYDKNSSTISEKDRLTNTIIETQRYKRIMRIGRIIILIGLLILGAIIYISYISYTSGILNKIKPNNTEITDSADNTENQGDYLQVTADENTNTDSTEK
jgi:hypothetical protein